MKKIYCILTVLICLVSSKIFAQTNLDSPFKVRWEKTIHDIKPNERFQATIVIEVPEGHYIYADKTEVDFKSLEGLRIDDVVFPEPTKREDPYFKKKLDVYEGTVFISIIGHLPEKYPIDDLDLTVLLKFQGCSEKVCFYPEKHDVEFAFHAPALPMAKPEIKPVLEPKDSSKSFWAYLKLTDFSKIFEQGTWFSIFIVFLAGFLVSLTPCIWPLIPVTLLIIGVEAQRKWWKNVLLAATLVLGIVLVNTSLGLLAVFLGKGVGFLFQNRLFLALVVIFFVLMSLSMFGLFEIHLLKPLQNKLSKLGGKGFRGAFLVGLGTGLIAAPCASPVLIALLGFVALKQNYFIGAGYLFMFGLGLGLVFILIGSGFGILASHIKGGAWLRPVKGILGVILLLPAFFYFKTLVNLDIAVPKSKVAWVSNIEHAKKFAQDSNRPMMIDFYARWCPPCLELDRNFFSKDEVLRLSYQLVPVRVDATVETPAVEEILEKYKIRGWPTILFISPQGKIYQDLTVAAFDPDLLKQNMRKAIKRAQGSKK
ncbi:MAG: cytochrome c biogenesis protein CcdA [Pseudomonadota bacterium]